MFKIKKNKKNQKILIISSVLFILIITIFFLLNGAKKATLRNEVTSKLDVQHQISKNLAGITETYSYKSFTSGVPTHVVYEDESYLGVPTGVKSDFLIIPDGVQALQDLGYSKSVLGNNYRIINEGKDVVSSAWDYVKNKETDKYTGYRLRGSELFIPFEGLDSRTTWEKNAPEFLGGKTAREKLDELQTSNPPENKVQPSKKELTSGGSGDGAGNTTLGTPGVPGSSSGNAYSEFNGVVGSDKQMHKLDENGNPVILNPNTNSWEPDSTSDAVIDQSNQKEQTGQDKIDGFRNLDPEKQSELFDDVSKIRIGQTIAENQELTKEEADKYKAKSEAIAEKWGYDKNDFAKLDSDYSQAFSPKSDATPPSDPQEKIEWFKNLDSEKKNELFDDVSQIRIGQTIAENQGLTKEQSDYYRTKSENAAEKWGYDKNDFAKLDSDYRSAFTSGNPVESETIDNNLEPFDGEFKGNTDPSKLNPPSLSAREAYQTLNDFAQNGTDPRSWSEYLNPLGPSLQEKVNDLQKTAGLTPKVEQFGGIDLNKGDVSEPVKKLDDYFNNMQDPRSLSERINPFGPTVEEKINSLENQIREEESQKKQILNGADSNYQDAMQKYANGEISEEEKNKALEKLQEETDKYLKETAVISQPLSPETSSQNNFDFNSESFDRSEGDSKDVKTTGDRTGDKTGTSDFWERDENQYSPEVDSVDKYNNRTAESSKDPYDFKDNFVSGNGSPEYPFSDWTSENIAKAFDYDEKTGELKLNKDWKEQINLPGGEYYINPPSKAEIIEGLYKENEIDLKTKGALEKKNKAGTLKEKISEEQDVYSAKENETIEGKPDSEKDREIKPGEVLKTSQ